MSSEVSEPVWQKWAAPILLVLVGCLSYYNSLEVPFLFDDPGAFGRNIKTLVIPVLNEMPGNIQVGSFNRAEQFEFLIPVCKSHPLELRARPFV